mmetsp:Transcript_22322/g.55311  ORF Transcript_22322/g.55311 Transcript_22322/m.55311 type:complete len:107 (-) Transcript_22322:78-398(-)
MKFFGSTNFQIASVLLLNGIVPKGIGAFVSQRTMPGIVRENGNFRHSGNSRVATAESSETEFEVPQARWNCPTHEDVCSESGVTLSRYMKEMVRANSELEEIESST